MDLEKIKELMTAMEEKGMTKIALKEKDGFELEIEKGSTFEAASYSPPIPAAIPQVDPQVIEKRAEKEEGSKETEPKKGLEVTSPMVGTFYTSASPEDPPFVKVGDTVSEETVIGIVEAMKVMNEIRAGKSGVVTEIFVGNAHPVEFGTKLLMLAES